MRRRLGPPLLLLLIAAAGGHAANPAHGGMVLEPHGTAEVVAVPMPRDPYLDEWHLPPPIRLEDHRRHRHGRQPPDQTVIAELEVEDPLPIPLVGHAEIPPEEIGRISSSSSSSENDIVELTPVLLPATGIEIVPHQAPGNERAAVFRVVEEKRVEPEVENVVREIISAASTSTTDYPLTEDATLSAAVEVTPEEVVSASTSAPLETTATTTVAAAESKLETTEKVEEIAETTPLEDITSTTGVLHIEEPKEEELEVLLEQTATVDSISTKTLEENLPRRRINAPDEESAFEETTAIHTSLETTTLPKEEDETTASATTLSESTTTFESKSTSQAEELVPILAGDLAPAQEETTQSATEIAPSSSSSSTEASTTTFEEPTTTFTQKPAESESTATTTQEVSQAEEISTSTTAQPDGETSPQLEVNLERTTVAETKFEETTSPVFEESTATITLAPENHETATTVTEEIPTTTKLPEEPTTSATLAPSSTPAAEDDSDSDDDSSSLNLSSEEEDVTTSPQNPKEAEEVSSISSSDEDSDESSVGDLLVPSDESTTAAAAHSTTATIPSLPEISPETSPETSPEALPETSSESAIPESSSHVSVVEEASSIPEVSTTTTTEEESPKPVELLTEHSFIFSTEKLIASSTASVPESTSTEVPETPITTTLNHVEISSSPTTVEISTESTTAFEHPESSSPVSFVPEVAETSTISAELLPSSSLVPEITEKLEELTTISTSTLRITTEEQKIEETAATTLTPPKIDDNSAWDRVMEHIHNSLTAADLMSDSAEQALQQLTPLISKELGPSVPSLIADLIPVSEILPEILPETTTVHVETTTTTTGPIVKQEELPVQARVPEIPAPPQSTVALPEEVAIEPSVVRVLPPIRGAPEREKPPVIIVGDDVTTSSSTTTLKPEITSTTAAAATTPTTATTTTTTIATKTTTTTSSDKNSNNDGGFLNSVVIWNFPKPWRKSRRTKKPQQSTPANVAFVRNEKPTQLPAGDEKLPSKNNKPAKKAPRGKCSALKICTSDAECGGEGTCEGALLGTCACTSCPNSARCTSDSQCGGLRGACRNGSCDCARSVAPSFTGEKLAVALFEFCQRPRSECLGATRKSSACLGLACNVGRCVC